MYALIDPTPTAAGACGVVTDGADDDEVLCGDNNDTVSSCNDVCVYVADADADKSLAVVVSSDCGTYVDVAGVYFSFLE